MADFVEVVFEDGSSVLFQSAESGLVAQHAGGPDVEPFEKATEKLQSMAQATKRVAETFTSMIRPDEVQLELGVGVSGEVGWFFAKSEIDATLKLTLTWKPAADPAPGTPQSA